MHFSESTLLLWVDYSSPGSLSMQMETKVMVPQCSYLIQLALENCGLVRFIFFLTLFAVLCFNLKGFILS